MFRPRVRVLAKVFYRGEAEVKYRASARIRIHENPNPQELIERSQSELWPDSHSYPSKLTKQVPKIIVYLQSPEPFYYAVSTSAHPPHF